MNDYLKIETIKAFDGNEISFCPKRGGIITSIKFHDKEILYLDKETFGNRAVSVKGGIPILFPNAGPIESPKFPGLKQHGFARNSSKWKVKKDRNSFKEVLVFDSENFKSYPYKFRLFIEGKFEANGSFTLIQEVENLEENKNIPISFGLHPYFIVPKNKKNNIKFNFKGGKFIEEQIEKWANGEFVSVDNPKTPMEIIIPSLGTLILNVSTEYKKIWIWSMKDKDFICIEPIMRNEGGLLKDPEEIKPRGTFSANINLSLKVA